MAGSRRGAAAGVLAGLCLLVACTPSPGEPPSPTPTVSVSSASPTPTENAIERQERLDFEAAEKSYRAFRAEYYKVVATGGSEEATPIMKANAAGPYLADYVSVTKGYKQSAYRRTGTEKIDYVRRGLHSSKRLLIEVCEDSSKTSIVDRSGKVIARGEVRTAELDVRLIDRSWKVWTGTGRKVTRC